MVHSPQRSSLTRPSHVCADVHHGNRLWACDLPACLPGSQHKGLSMLYPGKCQLPEVKLSGHSLKGREEGAAERTPPCSPPMRLHSLILLTGPEPGLVKQPCMLTRLGCLWVVLYHPLHGGNFSGWVQAGAKSRKRISEAEDQASCSEESAITASWQSIWQTGWEKL